MKAATRKDSLNELALFAGVGGGLLGTKALGWRPVCYVEWNRYAVQILQARIRDGYLEDAPIWDDANTFDGRPWAGLVDVVSAGFPCQPFSSAGKGLAEADPRNGWPATIKIIRAVRPPIAWLENVPGLLSKPYFGTILGDLAEAGYSAEWDCVSAAEVGANHKRERLWILAYANGSASNLPEITWRKEEMVPLRNGNSQSMANSKSTGWKAYVGQSNRNDQAQCGEQIRQSDGSSARSAENLADANGTGREKFHTPAQPGWAGVNPQGGAAGVNRPTDRPTEPPSEMAWFGTPGTRGIDGGAHQRKTAKENGTFVAHNGGKLNPNWVEWLMGWPIGWTDLKPLETDKFQMWLLKRGYGSVNELENGHLEKS